MKGVKGSAELGKALLVITLIFLCSFNTAYATPECSGPLPEYLAKAKNHYVGVTFKQDDCHPVFSFATPPSYSRFGFKYSNSGFYFVYPKTFGEFDAELRKHIAQFEALPSAQKYYDRIKQDEDLLEARRNVVMDEASVRTLRASGEDPFWEQEKKKMMDFVENELKNREIIKPFLKGKRWGDYSGCRCLNLAAATGFGRDKNGNLKMVSIEGLTCNGPQEINLRFNIENGAVKEAYVFGQDSSSYKKVYP